jgi:hypothetical protein
MVGSLRRAARAAASERVRTDEARAIVAIVAEASGRPRSGWPCSPPVAVAAGSLTKEGHGSPADWLGAFEGSSTGRPGAVWPFVPDPTDPSRAWVSARYRITTVDKCRGTAHCSGRPRHVLGLDFGDIHRTTVGSLY